MRHRILVVLLSIAYLAASVTAARAAELPVLDPQAVPHLTPETRAIYASFVLGNVPRAFAVATSGIGGWQSGGHGGGGAYDLGRRFGPCLLRFVLDSPTPTECPGETQ